MLNETLVKILKDIEKEKLGSRILLKGQMKQLAVRNNYTHTEFLRAAQIREYYKQVYKKIQNDKDFHIKTDDYSLIADFIRNKTQRVDGSKTVIIQMSYEEYDQLFLQLNEYGQQLLRQLRYGKAVPAKNVLPKTKEEQQQEEEKPKVEKIAFLTESQQAIYDSIYNKEIVSPKTITEEEFEPINIEEGVDIEENNDSSE